MDHIPHTDDKYGPFEPSRRPQGDPRGRQTTLELNQAEAEIISLDGVQVAIHLTSFAHYGSIQLKGRQGGKGAGPHSLVVLNGNITLQDLSDKELSHCGNTARIDSQLWKDWIWFNLALI